MSLLTLKVCDFILRVMEYLTMSNECSAEVYSPAVRRYRLLKYISNVPDNPKNEIREYCKTKILR